MTTIAQYQSKLISLQLRDAVPVLIKQTSYEIEALNKQQLYNYGVDSRGIRLAPYKNKYYAQEKNYMNPRPGLGQPDGFLTGAWYQGFNVIVKERTFEVDSTDSKSQKLKNMWGDEVFGLTKNNIKVYATGVFYIALKKYIAFKLS